MKQKAYGLSTEEVRKRMEQGEGNITAATVTKTYGQIIKENVFTLFNFLNFLIAGLLFAAGAYSNMLFIAIILLNLVIGIAQECKAKKLVDELSLLNRPGVCVMRDGREQKIETDQVVRGDWLLLESGSQICSDATVREGSLEVNESLLTEESDPVVKQQGSSLLSGSFVISGRAYAEVTHVGNENYAARLVNEVKKEKKIQSELLGSMKKVTRFTSMLIIPLGILLFLEAVWARRTPADQAVVSSAAALLGMLPKGLVLLISVSLAAGVIRLAKKRILIQNLYSLETLAHVDTLCLDKTGTITDGSMKVRSVLPLAELPAGQMDALVQSYMAACVDNNSTINALKEKFLPDAVYRAAHVTPFSSGRKWGCISFEGIGSVFVGAPERILETLPANLSRELEQGRRLVAIGYSGREWEDTASLPEGIQPLYAVVLEDTIRKGAENTLEFFRREGVEVKVISGDHVKTVSATARRAGLRRWKGAVDLAALGERIDYEEICEKYAVFARVTPAQKQELVKALQKRGHKAAMTGDGVNDLLALREADCSVAVADGSYASRQLAQVVLLDSDFTHLPQVVMEGRKVIHNVTRTAGVFFIKTIYSTLVSLICLLGNIPFPFIPIQITLVDACIEAYPSFLTIWESDTRRIQGGFLKTAISHALPFGLAVTAMIGIVSLSAPFASGERQTVMYLLLIFISMAAVFNSCIPFTRLRAFLCVSMVLGTSAALYLFPVLLALHPVTSSMAAYTALGAAVSVVFLLTAENLRKYFSSRKERKRLDRSRISIS
ncbi:MAG TPA: HAD-IC family P-type ATPase [Candidatus Choladousia intestinavium]|uniref:HAD-IC family P-type ATPase n=1 Tax=Candidatus Choladousia intestinavium TaxID=2840727 RepID=A0A9D1AAG1_9FIRM|nr:HAD-IC family P-type ATPase [Candidatus Choladousia intestinavium]